MRKIFFLRFILVLFIPIFFTSCEKNAFFNAGEVITREILLENYISDIEVNTMFDITLVQDTINKALVTCGENLQPDIEIFVKNDTLYLNNSVKYKWSRSYDKIKLDLHLKSIPQLTIWKPVYITTRDTFKTNSFFLIDWGMFTELDVNINVNSCYIDVSSENFGHYTLKGKAVNAFFLGWGSSFFYAEGLQVQNCIVKQRSIGDIYINVLNELNVTIETTGKVYYYGNPSTIVINNRFSEDQLIHLP